MRNGWVCEEDTEVWGLAGAAQIWYLSDVSPGEVPMIAESADIPGQVSLIIAAPDEDCAYHQVDLPKFPACMDMDDVLQFAMELAENYAAAHGLRQ